VGHYFLTWRSSRRKTSVCSGRKFVTKTYEQRKYQKCSSHPRLSSSPFPRWQARPNSFAWTWQELHISGAAARQSIPTPKVKIVKADTTSDFHYSLSKKNAGTIAALGTITAFTDTNGTTSSVQQYLCSVVDKPEIACCHRSTLYLVYCILANFG
jgi:hypothetical protein